jgi:hypothetical protein
MVVANILDPVHDTLDPTVWDAVHESHPKLKPQHKDWILSTILETLKAHGYGDMDKWLEVYFTGSLTTFQYSEESDADVSLFVNTDVFPEWGRAEMIAVMVDEIDGKTLPGTTHPMQCFVVAQGIRPNDLYKPGLRSGYLIEHDRWLIPPERDRSHDVQREQSADYQYALECADKMERLLRYEPDKAVTFWHQIHARRRRDHQAGKGDYSQSNIIYKFLSNRGLFPALEEATGEYIAKQAAGRLMPHPRKIDMARERLNISRPVRFMPTYKGVRGGYAGISRDPQTGEDSHLIYFDPRQHDGAKNWSAWHELAHAYQHERGDEFAPTNDVSDEEYWQLPKELEAEQIAEQHADMDLWEKTASELPRVIYNKFTPKNVHPRTNVEGTATLPFVYDPADKIVHLGPANSYHWELIQKTPELRVQYPMDRAFQEFSAMSVPHHLHGRLEWPAKHTDFMGLTADNIHHREAVNSALGATTKPERDWGDVFSSTITEGLNVGQEAQLTSQQTSASQGSVRGAHRQAEALDGLPGDLRSVHAAGEVREDDNRPHQATLAGRAT